MSQLLSDFRHAFRTFLARPIWMLVIVVTLAIGIGATTSIFSVVEAVILKPLPFREPERLVHIWEGGRGDRYQPGENPDFIYARPGSLYDWQTQSSTFESISAHRWRKITLTSGDRAENFWSQEVLENFFETLGTSALLGRTFNAADYRPGASQRVILSYHIWERRFGKDPHVVGRVVSFDREPCEVVGVMPRGFFPTRDDPPDLWTPHWPNEKEKADRVSWGLTVYARLKPGITLQQAQSDLDVIAGRMAQDHPQAYQNMGAVVVPVAAQVIGSTWKLFLLLSLAVGLLMLIACVNVATLFLARALDREKEFSIRITLGATRVRLLRQLLFENSLVAVAAAVLGLGVAAVGTRTLIRLLPAAAHLSRLDTATINLPVLGLISGIVLAAILSFSLLPLVRLNHGRPYETLKAEGRSASLSKSKRRLGHVFVVSEFALSLVLLVVGALLVQSFRQLSRVDPGFPSNNLLALEVQVPQFRYGPYKFEDKNTSREQMYERLEQRLTTVPGVESVGLTAKLPLHHDFDPWAVSVVGRPSEPVIAKPGEVYAPPTGGFAKHGETSIQRVNPAFLKTLGAKLVRGRFLEEQDTADHPLVAVVNETFARQIFPNDDPVGKQVIIDHTSSFPRLTIVGVVRDFKMNALDRKPLGEMFWSIRQSPPDSIWVVARTRTTPAAVSAALRKEIHDFDADLPIVSVESMETVIEDSLWRTRVAALLLGLLASIAVALAVTGIYSVMSYSVSQRTKELGIRIAFGARQRDISSLVLGETLRLAGIGTLLGCASALVAGRFISQQLYGVEGSDPATYLVASVVLVAVALAASYAPALRAVKVDPMVTLQ
jgi:predicted permease